MPINSLEIIIASCPSLHRKRTHTHSHTLNFLHAKTHQNQPTTSQRHVRIRQFRPRLLFCRPKATSKRLFVPNRTGRELQLAAAIQGFLALFLHVSLIIVDAQHQPPFAIHLTRIFLPIRQIPNAPVFGRGHQHTNWWLLEFRVRCGWWRWWFAVSRTIRRMDSSKRGWTRR